MPNACAIARVIALAITVVAAHAADLGWARDHDGTALPASWEQLGDGALRFERGDLHIAGPAATTLHAVRALGIDGSDAAPLRFSCRVDRLDANPVVGLPAALVMQWDEQHAIAVAIADAELAADAKSAPDRRAHGYLVNGAAIERAKGEPLSGSGIAWLRIVVATRDVSAFASRDGLRWHQIVTVAREGAFAGAPKRALIGRGVPGLTSTAPAADVAWRLRETTLANDPPVTATRMPAGYRKLLTWEDTITPIDARGRIARWHVIGPFTDGEAGHDALMRVDPATPILGKSWVAYDVPENARGDVVNLQRLLGVKSERQICYAVGEIVAENERDERFFFDSAVSAMLFVNDRHIADHYDWRWPTPLDVDRLTMAERLRAGPNRIALRVVTGVWGVTNIALRHESADPATRISLLRQLLADFPDEPDHAVPALADIARRWEAQGHLAQAALAWNDVLERASVEPEQIDHASFERARLHRLLRDREALIVDIEQVAQRRGDGLTAQIGLAKLWEQMGFTERGGAILDALWAREDLTPAAMIDIQVERVRLLGEDPRVVDELRALAARLPANNADRAWFTRAAARRDLQAGREAAVARLADEAAADPAQAARLHELLAGHAEAAKDAPARLKRLKRVAALRPAPTFWEDLLVEVALASDDKAAPAAWRAALARVPGADAAAANARSEYLRAALAATPNGAVLNARLAALRASGGTVRTGPVRDWRVVGPFPNPEWSAYSTPPVDPRRADPNQPVDGKAWVTAPPEAYASGYLNIAAVAPGDHCVVVAHTVIETAEPTAAQLRCGADDGLVLWLNGEKIFEDRVQRGIQPGSLVVPVQFRKGPNALLAMVQNGGGGFALEVAVHADADLTLLNAVDGGTPEALIEATAAYATAGRGDDAAAIASLVLRAFPDRPDLQLHAVQLTAASGAGGQADSLAEWLEAFADRRAPHADPARMQQIGEQLVDARLGAGDLAGAVAGLRRLARSAADPNRRAWYMIREGDVFRMAGQVVSAGDAYQAAFAAGLADEGMKQHAWRGLEALRGWKDDDLGRGVSLDAQTLVQTAERQAAAGDLERALKSWQKAIDEHGGGFLVADDGGLVGVAAKVAAQLGALDPAGIAAYRKLVDNRAKAAAARAGDDAGTLARIIAAWPASSAAVDARRALASRELVGGGHGRAAALVAQALALPGTSANADPAAVPLALAKHAYAAIAAGDGEAATTSIDLLAGRFASTAFATAGQATTGAAYATRARAALDKRKPPGDWPTSGGDQRRSGRSPHSPQPVAARLEIAFPINPGDTLAPTRSGSGYRHHAIHAAVVGGLALWATADECFAVDLAIDGGASALRWRAASGAQPAARGAWAQGLPDHAVSVADGAVFARVLVGGGPGPVYALAARELGDGALRWQAEPVDATVASSPAGDGGAVFVVLQHRNEPHRRWVACYDARTGVERWRAELPAALAEITLTNHQGHGVGHHGAAPSVSGGEVFVATDAGGVACVDAGSGIVRWVRRYPVAWIDPADPAGVRRHIASRAASRVVVAGDALVVCPRDSLALLCLERRDGALRWQRPLSTASALIGAIDGDVVVQDRGIERLAGGDGRALWRWAQPARGSLHGVGAIAADAVLVASDGGLHRIGRDDGRELSRRAWSEMGDDAAAASAPGNLVPLADGVIALGDDRLVVYAGAGALARLTIPERRAHARVATTGLAPAALPAPLHLRWRLRASRGRGIQPLGADLLLHADDRIVRFDPKKEAVRWQAALAPGTQRLIDGAGLVVSVQAGALVAYDAETGARRWTWSNPDGDGTFEDRYGGVAVTPAAVCARVGGGDVIAVIDPATGAERTRIQIPGARWCGVRGDQLIAIAMRDKLIHLESRALSDGAPQPPVALSVNPADQIAMRFLPIGDDALMVIGERFGARVDLRERREVWKTDSHFVNDGGRLLFPEIVGDRLRVWSRHNWGNWWTHLFDLADGKARAEKNADGGMPPSWYHLWTPVGAQDTVQYVTHDPWNRWTMIGRDGAGAERWRVDRGQVGQIHPVGLYEIGGSLLELMMMADSGWIRYATIDAATGKATSEGRLPSSYNGTDLPARWVDGMLVVGTRDGFAAITPTAVDVDAAVAAALAQPAPTDAGRRAGVGELIARARAPEVQVLAWDKPIALDGALDDWPAGDPLDLGGWHRVVGDGAADAARARVTWDAANVYLAVEVDDRQPGAGGVGDELLIAIDPIAHGKDRDRSDVLMVFAAGWRDNLPGLFQRSGPALGGEGLSAARVCIARGERLTYEVALPWSALRQAADQRPGAQLQMGLGLRVVDVDGASAAPSLAWGYDPDAVDMRAFARLRFVDLTPERLRRAEAFVAALPTHQQAWQFLQRLGDAAGVAGPAARAARYRAFVEKYPGSSFARGVVDHVQSLLNQAGDPEAKTKAAELYALVEAAPKLPVPTREELIAGAELAAAESSAAPLIHDATQGLDLAAAERVHLQWLTAHRASPQAHAVLAALYRRLAAGDASAAAKAAERCVELMQELDLPRVQRRAFWSVSPGIVAWRSLGWITPEEGAANIDQPLPPDKRLAPRYKLGDREIAWRSLPAADGVATPSRALGAAPSVPWPVAYLHTRVEAPAAREAYAYLGVAGHAALFVNGRRVGATLTGERAQPGAHAVAVQLRAGVNDIVIKLSHPGGQPAAHLRLGDAEGRPIEGVSARLPPVLSWSAVSADGARAVLVFDAPLDPDSAGALVGTSIGAVGVRTARVRDGGVLALELSGLAAGARTALPLVGLKGADGTPLEPGATAPIHNDGVGRVPGFAATWFADVTLGKPVLGRIEPRIDSDFGNGSPDPAVPVDGFAARWTGTLVATASGDHVFTTRSDDGVRLWIDGTQLIDNWTGHAPVDNSGTIALEAGKSYALRMEYFEGGGPGMIRLSWTQPGGAPQVLDAAHIGSEPTSDLFGP